MTKKPHHNTGNRYAAKGDKNAEAFLHVRCLKENKEAWEAKADAECGSLTAWVTKNLNKAAGVD